MVEPTFTDYDAAHLACGCPTAPNNPRVRVAHPGCKLTRIACAIANERAWLLADATACLGCPWQGTRAEILSERTDGSCPECGQELPEASELRAREEGLD